MSSPPTGDLLQTNGDAAHNDSAGDLTNASQEEPSNEGDEEEAIVPVSTSADPYSGLDNAFGVYLADEPRPQKDLLDMI